MINPRQLKALHENKKLLKNEPIAPLNRDELITLDDVRVKNEDKLELIDRYVKLDEIKRNALKKINYIK